MLRRLFSCVFLLLMVSGSHGAEPTSPPLAAWLLRTGKTGAMEVRKIPDAMDATTIATVDAPLLCGESATSLALLSQERPDGKGSLLVTLLDKKSGTVTRAWPLTEPAMTTLGEVPDTLHLNSREACFFTPFPRVPTLLCLSLRDGKTRRLTMPLEAEAPCLTGDEEGRLAVGYIGREGAWLYDPAKEEFQPVKRAFSAQQERFALGEPATPPEKLADLRFIPGHGLFLLTAGGQVRLLLNRDFAEPGEEFSFQLPSVTKGGKGKGVRLLPPLDGGATVGVLHETEAEGLAVTLLNLAIGMPTGDIALPPWTRSAMVYGRQDGAVYLYNPMRGELVRCAPGERDTVLARLPGGDTTPFSPERILTLLPGAP